MLAIISPLDASHDQQVRELWRMLETDCALTAIQKTPIPHFTWVGAETYEKTAVESALRGLARAARPFTVRASGLGVFPGPQPVLYIALVKDAGLLRFHESVWQATAALASNPSRYYTPPFWTPHITLAYGDVTPQNAPCALQRLLFTPLEWQLHVDSLAIVAPSDQSIYEPCCCFPFGEP